MRTSMSSSGRRWAGLIGLLVVVMALAVPISVMAFSGTQTINIKAKASNVAGASLKVVAGGPDYKSLTGSIKFVSATGITTTLPITFSDVAIFGGQQQVFLDATTGAGGIGVGIATLEVPHPVIGVATLPAGGGTPTGPPLAIFGPFPGDEVKFGLKSKLK